MASSLASAAPRALLRPHVPLFVGAGSALAPVAKRSTPHPVRHMGATTRPGDGKPAPGDSQGTYSNQTKMPRLPVPELRDTADKYLRTVQPLTRSRPEAYSATRAAVEAFAAPGQVGEQAQVLLRERAASEPNWLEKWWDVQGYLADRSPVAVNANYYFWLSPDGHGAGRRGGTPQTDRAARLVAGALKHKVAIDTETLAPDVTRAGPQDMNQVARLFAHARVPARDRDKLINYGCAPIGLPAELQHFATEYRCTRPRHIAVIAGGGHVFSLDVLGSDALTPLPTAAIRAGLDAAAACAAELGPVAGPGGVGALTALNRDTWADARDRLVADASSAAARSLDVLDSALFVVVLDPVSPSEASMSAATKQFLHGIGDGDRWFDKHQIIVTPDGQAAGNFEHGPGDGMTTLALTNFMYADSLEALERPEATASDAPDPQLLRWELTSDSVRDVEAAVEANAAFFASINSTMTVFDDFGGSAMKAMKVSPDAFAQLAMQLAFHKQFGYSVATYESNSTRGFLHGRTETVRTVSNASVEFCREMDMPATLTPEKKGRQAAALRAAAAAHAEYMSFSKEGLGVDRHLFGLRNIIREHDLELPAEADIYADPSFALSNTWRMSTSHCGSPALRVFGFGPVAAAGYGLGYHVTADGVHLSCTSNDKSMDVDTYTRLVCDSLEQMRAVLCD